MLADHVSRLLTAYVDGELDAIQKQTALRLLQDSPEARSYLRRLQDDSDRLRRLTSPRLGRDLTPVVLQTIADRKLRPGSRRYSRRPAATVPVWTGWAVAAGIMLVIGSASYFFFTANKTASVAVRPKPRPSVPESPKDAPAERVIASKDATVPTEKQEPVTPPAPVDVAQKPPEKPPEKVAASPTRPAEDASVNAVPVANMEMFTPRTPGVNIALLKLRDLEQEKARLQVRDLFKKEPSHRLELPCRDGTKAFDRLQPILRAHGVGLLIEQAAQLRLKNPQLKTNYVLYLEDLLPDELVTILDQVSRQDAKMETKKKGEGLFDSIVITQLTAADRKELSTLLGVDPTTTQPTKPTSPLGIDPKKPVSDGTAGQVANTLTGQGTNPRPEPGKTGKPPEHWALVLPYNPVRPNKDSAEVKRFLAGRKAPRAGTVQVLLVLRGTNG